MDYEEVEYYDEEDEYEEYEDVEAELYAFKRKEPYPREVREVKRRAIPRSESRKEESTQATPQDTEMEEVRPEVKKSRRKMLPAPL